MNLLGMKVDSTIEIVTGIKPLPLPGEAVIVISGEKVISFTMTHVIYAHLAEKIGEIQAQAIEAACTAFAEASCR